MLDIIEDNIDYEKTIRSISNSTNGIYIPIKDLIHRGLCLSQSNSYSQVFNDENENNIRDSLQAEPDGATLVSSGILVANNIFKQEKNNNKKLMVIISDGHETNETNLSDQDGDRIHDRKSFHITQSLINKGMCQSIANNEISMAFIAVGYNPEKNFNTNNYIDWKKCVGEDNYYEAKNAHQLEVELMEALGAKSSNEVGRSIPK